MPDTPMKSSTSLQASTSMMVQTSTDSDNSGNPKGLPIGGQQHALPVAQPAITKYAKIQPAIAIKPKPTNAPKSSFNPTYNQQKSKPPTLLQGDSLINTSRKWVLPPRPRPGRKPTTGNSPGPEKAMQKKKTKIKREDVSGGLPLPQSTSTSDSPVLSKRRLGSNSAGNPVLVGASGGSPQAAMVSELNFGGTPVSSEPSPTATSTRSNSTQPTPKPCISSKVQITDLQRSYLAKIKEQELIRNYIDVLTNQIKQLKFVQSGVITFDVLNDTSETSSKSHNRNPQACESFDQVNNIHDLDKYLAYLTTQSNVLHSVTKKSNSMGLGVGRPLVSEQTTVSRQVRKYFDRSAQSSTTPDTSAFTTPEASGNETFTPSLLQPLKMTNLATEEGLTVDIVNKSDLLGSDRGRSDDAMADSPVELLNLLQEGDMKTSLGKKSKKMGCGFCTNDTPCVCFDADNF